MVLPRPPAMPMNRSQVRRSITNELVRPASDHTKIFLFVIPARTPLPDIPCHVMAPIELTTIGYWVTDVVWSQPASVLLHFNLLKRVSPRDTGARPRHVEPSPTPARLADASPPNSHKAIVS